MTVRGVESLEPMGSKMSAPIEVQCTCHTLKDAERRYQQLRSGLPVTRDSNSEACMSYANFRARNMKRYHDAVLST